ncbi:MAG: DoxX family protein [Candidatus Paceibacterota bacterium]|jgi:uncharacterized membrane protein YphA (DoxX/SURF4 family)
MNNFMNRFPLIAPAFLRIGITVVYLWFGLQQLISPLMWVSYIPKSIVALSPVSAQMLVYCNGAFEIVFGLALLFGFFTRVSALLLAVHMLDITLIVGYNAIGVRDYGIVIATFAVFFFGPDVLSLDSFFRKSKEGIVQGTNI